MNIEEENELVELVGAALKSLSVARPVSDRLDYRAIRENEVTIARMVKSLSNYRSGSSSSDEIDGPGMT